MAGVRVHVVMPRELVERVDAAVGGGSRGEFVRRAVERRLECEDAERALGDVGTGGSLPASAAPPSSMSPAPAEQPAMSEVERKGFENLTGIVASRSHAPNCKCPVCS